MNLRRVKMQARKTQVLICGGGKQVRKRETQYVFCLSYLTTHKTEDLYIAASNKLKSLLPDVVMFVNRFKCLLKLHLLNCIDY